MRGGDEAAFSGASLLLVEDDPLNAEIACRTLQKIGCQVNVASDGLAAARMWEEGDFDLILMDCEMAEMDGFEASRHIREREGQAGRRRTPIVAFSAHPPLEIRERCIAAGMDDMLAKPVREARLRNMIRCWTAAAGGKPQEEPVREMAVAAPSVDRGVLDGIGAFQGASGRDLLRNVVARFADTARAQLSLMRSKHSEGESEEVRRIAHTLKSSSAALGANQVSRRCAEIELQAGRGNLASLPTLLSALGEELSAATGHLREIAAGREEPNRVPG